MEETPARWPPPAVSKAVSEAVASATNPLREEQVGTTPPVEWGER
jgi:hypothetical protein